MAYCRYCGAQIHDGDKKCPECGAYLVKKITKKESKLVCSNNSCSYSEPMESENSVEGVE